MPTLLHHLKIHSIAKKLRAGVIRAWMMAEKILLVLLFIFSLEFFSYHLIFLHKVIPGVTLGSSSVLDLSGKTLTEAQVLIQRRLESFEKQLLSLKIGPVERKVSLDDLGVSFDASESARSAYFTGRSRNLIADLKTEYQALFLKVKIYPSYRIDQPKFDLFLNQVKSELATQNASFYFKDGQLLISSSKEGLEFSTEDLSKNILKAVVLLDDQVEVTADPSRPDVGSEHMNQLETKLKSLHSARPIFYYGQKDWSISDEEFLSLFNFRDSSPSAFVSSTDGVNSFISKVIKEVNISPRAISFKAEEGKVTSFESGSDGLSVDEAGLRKAITEGIVSGSGGRLSITVNRLQPSVATNDYGITELIGEGVSNFAGSIPGRRRNIKTASTRLNGLLIPPDATFSFNESVGEITAQTGYDYAYIISEGRTILGTGGGVCQVSTTVFRAALNSGLPILKRTAHAYRVHYYEEGGSPIGFDSTVFAPSVDLQFKNDTGHYILVQSVFEGDQDTLIFRFYGTKDGRSVKIEAPVILSSSGAPAPLYQDDPSLPKGTVRQVDFAAGGATVYFKRLVERQGEILADDTFYSRYSPWRAIYLVGTKE